MLSKLMLTAMTAVTASAAMIDVMVGEGGLVYKPDSVMASKGDIIRFAWSGGVPHNVLSSDYDSPCKPNGKIASPVMLAGGMDFFVMVNSTDPLYMYCSVMDHCNDGMVMVVNAPTSSDSLDSYRSAAAKAEKANPEKTPAGGIVAAASATPFAMANSMSGSSASMTSEMASGMMSTMTGSAMAAATSGAANAIKAGGLGLGAVIAGAAFVL